MAISRTAEELDRIAEKPFRNVTARKQLRNFLEAVRKFDELEFKGRKRREEEKLGEKWLIVFLKERQGRISEE